LTISYLYILIVTATSNHTKPASFLSLGSPSSRDFGHQTIIWILERLVCDINQTRCNLYSSIKISMAFLPSFADDNTVFLQLSDNRYHM
jgi:hypothetical protein